MRCTAFIATALVLLGFANGVPVSNDVNDERGAVKNTLQRRAGIPVMQDLLENASPEVGKLLGEGKRPNNPTGGAAGAANLVGNVAGVPKDLLKPKY